MSSPVTDISRYESRRRLKREIETRLGGLSIGEALPPVRTLMREYGTSTTRLNGLFRELEKDGLIERRPGAGIFKAGVNQNSAASGDMRLQKAEDSIRIVVLLDSWPDGEHNFGADLFGLMRQQSLRAASRYHLTCEFADFATQGREELDRLSEYRDVDAIVAMPYSRKGLELMQMYQPLGKPVFCFFRNAGNPHVSSVYVDYYNGAYKAVEYLCILGHQRIGFIGMPLSPGNPAWIRDQGYRDALLSQGRKVDPDLILHVDHNHQEICEAVDRLLSLDDPMTALFTADGLMVSATLHALSDVGKNIPDDISLLCYDDEPECRTYRTPISVVRQPLGQTVEALLQEILARVKNHKDKRHEVAVLPELVLRESCRQYSCLR